MVKKAKPMKGKPLKGKPFDNTIAKLDPAAFKEIAKSVQRTTSTDLPQKLQSKYGMVVETNLTEAQTITVSTLALRPTLLPLSLIDHITLNDAWFILCFNEPASPHPAFRLPMHCELLEYLNNLSSP